MTSTSSRALATSLDKLSIGQDTQAAPRHSKAAPAETWEDEANSDTETEAESARKTTVKIPRSDSVSLPNPPPPTPSSPSMQTKTRAFDSIYQTAPPYGMNGNFDDRESTGSPLSSRGGGDQDRRPEKTTSTASRLIAAGIGQAPPKRTKEQREYDQAMKVQEKKKRDNAKEDEERKKRELEHARRAMWED